MFYGFVATAARNTFMIYFKITKLSDIFWLQKIFVYLKLFIEPTLVT